ncbi:hypothetical protein AB833_08980 [Chromatiales bacterium (ex Bugula neritina AB1)]|nr:hypothetical protein AB833_08980 [Chromatiales bacterium (ex Bugula neritina AB1)]
MKKQSLAVRCFKRPETSPTVYSQTWLSQWQREIYSSSIEIPSVLPESLGHVMPLLMCGEQSAALVFNRESARQTATRSARLFSAIEADELVHDDALQVIYSQLPVSPDEATIKRRAKRFYAAMGSGSGSVSAGELFARILHLDSCVCVIMNSVENGKLGNRHPYAKVFRRIKQDEERHVGISRQHLRWLDDDLERTAEAGREIRARLVELLRSEAAHFENLGVDIDILEKAMLRG